MHYQQTFFTVLHLKTSNISHHLVG